MAKKHTKSKYKSKENLNLNQKSTLKTAYVCAYHCAQLSYTIQHGTVLIIFPLILWTIIIAQIDILYCRGGEHCMKEGNRERQVVDMLV